MATLVMKGWRTISQPVSLAACIRDCTGSTLLDAKRSMESLVSGNAVSLTLSDRSDVASVMRQLEGFGVIVERAPNAGTVESD